MPLPPLHQALACDSHQDDLCLSIFAVSIPSVPSICMSRNTMSNCFPAASSASPVSYNPAHISGISFSISSFICSRMFFSSSHMAMFNPITCNSFPMRIAFPRAVFSTFYIGKILAQSAARERNLFLFHKKFKIIPKVFRHSSDTVETQTAV